jgi:hypothetical protein
MLIFNGILNDNGSDKKIILFLEDNTNFPYTSDCYINNVRVNINMDNNICTIQNTKYEYYIKKYDDELLLVGKEIGNFFHYVLSCFYKQNFFVLTNKDEV